MSQSDQPVESYVRSSADHTAEAPPFSRVWRAAEQRRRRRRTGRRLLLSAAALPVAIFLVVVLVPVLSPREPAPESFDLSNPELVELARSLSEWTAPLDFLLEPPGGDLMGVDSSDAGLPMPTELPTLNAEEVL